MAINFPNSPAINDIFTSGSQSWKWDGTKWVPVTGSANLTGDGVNILRRNGGFEVWQRGAGGSASFSPVSPSAMYTADGWYAITAGPNLTVSQQAGLIDGSQFCAKVGRIAGQAGVTLNYFGFPLDTDEIYPMLGKFVRLSFVAKAGANWSPASGNLDVYLATGTGVPVKLSAGFTGQVNAIATTQALTATATRYQFNSAAVIPINTRQVEVSFRWTGVGTAGADDTFSLDDVQLEIVPAATGYVSSDFQRLNFQEQLLLCQRHYWKSFLYGTAPTNTVGRHTGEIQAAQSAAAAATSNILIRHPVPMRGPPAMATYNPEAANGQARNLAANTDSTTTIFIGTPSALGADIGTVPAAGSLVGQTLAVHVIGDAGI